MKKLSELKPGDKGRISAVDACTCISQRMMALALVPGQQVEVIRFAPFGDPVMLRLEGSVLSVRRSEAECVMVDEESGA